MNSQEMLAWLTKESAFNPELEKLVELIAKPYQTPEASLFWVDQGLGCQRVFRICGNNGPTQEWMVYLIGQKDGKRFGTASRPIPTDKSGDREFVEVIVKNCFAEFRTYLEQL